MNRKTYVAIAATMLLMSVCGTAFADKAKFPWLSIAPEVGWQFFAKSTMETTYNSTMGPRNGVVVKAHVDIGGDKWALELAPLYAWQGSDSLSGNTSAFGGEITAAYRFSTKSIYPGIGIGFHGAYLFPTDNLDYGVELMARIPLGLTWYFVKYLGLTLEGGFMFGALGVRYKESAKDTVASNLSQHTEYAFNLGCDLLVGLRFP